jgi:hypothetical protein
MTTRDRSPKHVHNDGDKALTRPSKRGQRKIFRFLQGFEDLTVAIAVGYEIASYRSL